MNLYELNLGYAALLTAGGLIGFISKGSLPSLAAGAGSGLLVAGFTMYNWPYKTLAITLISGGLAYTMGNKFLATNKFMPAGLIAATSALTCIAQTVRWYQTGSLH
ncbi:unnamed protein product, partial [Mesorhabditis spiculigera]